MLLNPASTTPAASDVLAALDYLLTADAAIEVTDGGTGVFAPAAPGRSGTPVAAWTVQGDTAMATITGIDGTTFALSLTKTHRA